MFDKTMMDALWRDQKEDNVGVRPVEASDVEAVELRRKAKFRQTMIEARTAVICRLETEIDADMKAMLKEQVKHLDRLIARAERSCLETVGRNAETKRLVERFTSVGGVGNVTAISILAGLPEIGKLPDAKLNRLAGISPEEKQSGTKEWQRRIWGGRKDVRNALYMATVASIMWNSILGDYYRKKRAEGHPHKWAIVPTMRKMLSLLNRIAREPDFVPAPESESAKRNVRVGRMKSAA